MLFLVLSTTSAQEDFALQGKLIQGTADGEALPEMLPLTLQILTEDGEGVETFSAGSSSDGSFIFPDVPINDSYFYVVTTFWAGIEQSSLPMKYGEIQELENALVEFPLYEITDSLADVVANRGNLRIEFTDVNRIGVEILMELNYANLGDRIVLANPNTEDAAAFTIELPVGSLGIAPAEAPGNTLQRFVPVNQVEGEGGDGLVIPGIKDTQPMVPNWPNQMHISLFVPYEDGAVFDIRFPFAVNDIAIFVRQDTIFVESDILELSENTETTSGKVYQVYEQVEPLEPGEPYVFTLLGEPSVTVRPDPDARDNVGNDSSSSSSTLLIVFVGGAVLVFGGLMVWLMRALQAENRTDGTKSA